MSNPAERLRYTLPIRTVSKRKDGEPEVRQFDRIGLSVVLGLRSIEVARVGETILNRAIDSEDVVILWGPQALGKTTVAEQIGRAINTYSPASKDVVILNIDEAIQEQQIETGLGREELSIAHWIEANKRIAERAEQAAADGKKVLVDIVGMGGRTTRDRGVTALEALAKKPQGKLFVGFLPDPNLQHFAMAVRDGIDDRDENGQYTVPDQEVESYLDLEWGIVVTGMTEDSLYNRIPDPAVRGRIARELIARNGRTPFIKRFNREIIQSAAQTAYGRGEIQKLITHPIHPLIDQLADPSDIAWYRSAYYYMQNHLKDLGLSMGEDSKRSYLVLNKFRPPKETGGVFAFVHDGAVRHYLRFLENQAA